MSGYLDVKVCCKGSRGLAPWKAWKKQWCILRPSPLKEDGVFIVFHTSVGLASNSQIEIPRHSVVYRTESKSKCYSFGIFPTADSRKPLLLLAGQSESEAQLWIGRIRALLHDSYYKIDKVTSHKNGFPVSLIDNTFTNSCGLKGLYGNLIITRDGFQILDSFNNICKTLVKWEYISDVTLRETEKPTDRNKICIVTTNRDFEFGHGHINLFCHSGAALVKCLKNRTPCDSPEIVLRKLNRRISRSEGTLSRLSEEHLNRCLDDNQRDSGLSSCGPVSTDDDSTLRISMDDEGLVLKGKKASSVISAGMMISSQRLTGRNTATQSLERFAGVVSPLQYLQKTANLNRRSSRTSLASGIYEEISEYPPDTPGGSSFVTPPPRRKSNWQQQDNMYEVLGGECSGISGKRYSGRNPPPPLPPRTRNHGTRLDSTSDSGLDEESSCSTPHGSEDGKWTSLHSSIPRLTAKELDHDKSTTSKGAFKNSDKLHAAFGVFRKRIKSESQVANNKNSKTVNEIDSVSCQEGDTATRKRLFEFNLTPVKTSNKMKSSKISRALKKLGVGYAGPNLKNNSAKSCEALDFKEEICSIDIKSISNRCSKSEENLDYRFNPMVGIRNESFEKKKCHLNLSTEWCSEISDDNIKDLSIICTEESIKNSYPKDILDLLLKGKVEELEKKLKQRSAEEEYMLMSPCNLNGDVRLPQIKPQVQKVDKQNISYPAVNFESNYVVMKGA